ncbi:DUF6088 family protein [Paludibaculum fermentans]|uniref:DUF6088 family protein n=1 Tax=Paludibaculum fermentans TaxID=1473598 RepID=UPI003EBC07E2
MGESPTPSQSYTASIRQRIEKGGERVWRLEDFRDLPFAAAPQALSRLTRAGALERLSKGIYYKTRPTVFGHRRPNPAAIQKLAAKHKPIFPSGLAAANLLGFSTQTGRQNEVSTSAGSLPRKLVGQDTVIHARRPAAWNKLSPEDAALLEFLRCGGKTSEVLPEKTVQKTLALLSEKRRFERLLAVADTEPPRVRAMLGAIGEQLGKTPSDLQCLHDSLNPFSKYDFGLLAGLQHAKKWQSKSAREA